MPSSEFDLATVLQDVVSRGGSDLHLIHGIPPIVRIAGQIGALPYAALSSDVIRQLLTPFVSEKQWEMFEKEGKVNCAQSIEGVGRFRLAIHQALGTVGATIRVIPSKNYPLSALGLPPIVGTLANRRSGIILVTGATGSGKSTSMAAMLEWVNQTGRPGKIVTIEDPIENIFKPCRSIFVQREVGIDTPSFAQGIVDSLRQDPDILCIGELRDHQSIQAAMLAAETGHLVFSTLHTRDASKTAQRIVSAVPSGDQDVIREQLALTLEAVISQELLPRADGKGLVVACEILIATQAVRQLIRENKLEAINDAIQSGLQIGMISRDASIKNLYQKKLIAYETAAEAMRNPEMLGPAPAAAPAVKNA
jgi:twitching motility protein PilT